MKGVSIIGIQGVPANYGGFESLVENLIGDHKSTDVRYTVFCSSKDMPQIVDEYKGARLRYIPLRANGIQSIPYDMLSFLKLPKDTDTVLVLGVSGCIILPLFRLFSRKRLVINIDGLEHRRQKWGRLAKAFLKFSESMAVRYADVVIADNKGIQDYVREEYGKDSVLIAYGGDHAIRKASSVDENKILDRFSASPGNYAVSICRIEPENNCHVILEAFSRTDRKLVFVGNWNNSDYGRELKERYSKFPNISLHDPIYDVDVLYALRKNSGQYVHGHSAGGTNPSLVEAMFFGTPVLAYDVVYNRETTCGKANYWKDAEQLLNLLSLNDFDDGSMMKEIALKQYAWEKITRQYEELY